MNLTRHNMRSATLAKEIAPYLGKAGKLNGTLRCAYQKQPEQGWRFVMARYTDGQDAPAQREIYRDFAFVSTPLSDIEPNRLLELLEGEGVETDPDLPPIKIEIDNPNWSERLIPSHAGDDTWPVRRFSTSIVRSAYFSEEPLIGHGMPFHASASAYLKEFLGLSHFYSGDDASKGELILEFADRRGAIALDDKTLAISSERDDLCIVGQLSADRTVCVTTGEPQSIASIELGQIELWLVNTQNEVIDYRSSTEWPYQYQPPGNNEHKERYDETIRGGENEHCEFKPFVRLDDEKFSEIERSVCAFSNTKGGKLFIGVNDNAEIRGIGRDLKKAYGTDDIETSCIKYLEAIASRLRENLNTAQCFEIQSATLQGCRIIVITVSKAQDTNYLINANQVYVRRGATSIRMPPEEIASRATEKRGLWG